MTTSKNVEEFAAYVGIDWADQKHVIRLQTAQSTDTEAGEVEQRPEALAEWVAKLRERFRGGKIAVAIEQSRGAVVYHLMQYEFLEIYPINPKTLARYREAFSMNNASSDQTDADLIVELVRVHRDRLRRWMPEDKQTRLLRMLAENRRSLVDTVTEYTNRLTALLKSYYPQALELAGCLSTKMACDFLSTWPTVELLKTAEPSQLREFYRKHGSVRKEVIENRLKIVGRIQPLTTDEAIVEASQMMASAVVGQLRCLNAAIQECDGRIAEIFAEHPYSHVFGSFPGAGKVLAPRLTVAFGTEQDRYTVASAIQQFSGIAPVTEQSGKSKWVHRRYACPKFLKQSFHEYAAQSIHWSVWAKAYYDQQKDFGKGHHATIRALAFKWIRIMYRCWKDGLAYDEEIYLKALARRGSPLAERLKLNTDSDQVGA